MECSYVGSIVACLPEFKAQVLECMVARLSIPQTALISELYKEIVWGKIRKQKPLNLTEFMYGSRSHLVFQSGHQWILQHCRSIVNSSTSAYRDPPLPSSNVVVAFARDIMWYCSPLQTEIPLPPTKWQRGIWLRFHRCMLESNSLVRND